MDTAAKEIWEATVTIVSVSSGVVFPHLPLTTKIPQYIKLKNRFALYVNIQAAVSQYGRLSILKGQKRSRFFCARLLDELLGPIVCILSLLLGNQGGMGSSYYGGGGGGGSRGSMNGLGGGWGM